MSKIFDTTKSRRHSNTEELGPSKRIENVTGGFSTHPRKWRDMGKQAIQSSHLHSVGQFPNPNPNPRPKAETPVLILASACYVTKAWEGELNPS